MKWIGVVLLSLVFSLLPLSAGYAQSSDLSVRQRLQNELLILKTQLIGCEKAINGLKLEIRNLRESVGSYKELTNALKEQLDELSRELQTREVMFETLAQQAKELENSLRGLKTENTLLWVGIGVVGAVAVGTTIWALAGGAR